MDFYPPELVTPPLSLVALLGCGDLHNTVGEYLRQHRPPINSIGLAEPQSAIRFFGKYIYRLARFYNVAKPKCQ